MLQPIGLLTLPVPGPLFHSRAAVPFGAVHALNREVEEVALEEDQGWVGGA